jgi:hypothetical protein
MIMLNLASESKRTDVEGAQDYGESYRRRNFIIYIVHLIFLPSFMKQSHS